MTYQLNDVVRLKYGSPEHDLPAGTQGVVVLVFDTPRLAYEIEVSDEDGQCIAMLTALPEQLMPGS
jgi:Domain of unknown function (DUF4926)